MLQIFFNSHVHNSFSIGCTFNPDGSLKVYVICVHTTILAVAVADLQKSDYEKASLSD